MIEEEMIDCGEHGRVKWDGQCACVTCGAVWRLCDGGPQEHSPRGYPYCECGQLLVPRLEDVSKEEKPFTGRAICPSCYDRFFPKVPVDLLGDA